MFKSIPVPPRRKRLTAPTGISPGIPVAELLTAEKLRELLSYCLETGIFRWRVDRRGGAKAGSVAGRISSHGYQEIKINGKLHHAHRLAWLYVHGVWPSDQIDHINRVRTDNRIANLREATSAENSRNRSKYGNNTSGHVGVTWCKREQRWKAQIQHEGKMINLGYYDLKEDAIAARITGELLYWGAARAT